MRRAAPAQDGGELPSEIEGILHRDVHALARFRAVGVAGVAGDEDAGQARCDLFRRHVVELVGQPLADLVDRPPGDLLYLKRIGVENPPRLRDQVVRRDVAVGDPLAGVEIGEFDIEPDEITALARDDDDAAVAGRLDQRLEANVGEVGDGKHVHDAPGMVGGIAAQLAPDRLAHHAARAVTAHDVAGPDGLDLALMPGIEPLEA